MNVLAAIIAGISGTLLMSLLMAMAPVMGMPRMDIVSLLGTMFNPEGNRVVGWILHLMMGGIFALIYSALWSAGIGSSNIWGGLAFGAVHWLVAGLIMGGMPMLHSGIRAGNIEAPGVYMINASGMMSFAGGLLGHLIYGLSVALIYGQIARFAG